MNLRRMRYYRWQLLMLFISITTFLAFINFYTTFASHIAEAHVGQSVEKLGIRQKYIVLQDTQPIRAATHDLIDKELGSLLTNVNDVTFTAGITCGLAYVDETATLDRFARRSLNCYTVFTYPDLNRYFEVVDGQMPELITRPQQPENLAGLPHVQGIITQVVAETAHIEVGQRIIFTNTLDTLRVIEIVGIVQLREPDNPFWRMQTIMKDGVNTPVGDDLRFDFGIAVLPEAFTPTIQAVAPLGVYYTWDLATQPASISATTLADVEDDLRRTERELYQQYPDMNITNNLSEALSEIRTQVEDTEQVMLGFGLLLGALMLAQIFFITQLVVRDQTDEWQIRLQNGASYLDLLRLHGQTVLGLVVAGAVLSPVVAYGLLLSVTDEQPFALHGLPLLAGSFVVIGMVLLGMRYKLWAWKYRFTEIAYFRYFVDLALLVVGGGFLLRLYSVTDNATHIEVRTLGEPLNLIGFPLLIVGGSLLGVRWLMLITRYRLYPTVSFFLMATLMIGTAALTVNASYDNDSWEQAYFQIGSEAQIQLDRSVEPLDWQTLDAVENTEQAILLQDAAQQISVLGVENFPVTVEPYQQGGLVLPDDARELVLQLASEAIEGDPVEVHVIVRLVDDVGISFSLELGSMDRFITDTFTPYTLTLPEAAHAPWRLVSLSMNSRKADENAFEHTVYLDELVTLNAEGEQVMIEDFEATPLSHWTTPEFRRRGFSMGRTNRQSIESEASLRISYPMEQTGFFQLPIIEVFAAREVPLPLILSTRMARSLSPNPNNPLKAGAEGELRLNLPEGSINVAYKVVAVEDEFAGLGDNNRFVIAPIDHLLPAINRGNTNQKFYDVNLINLDLESRQPSDTLRDQLAGYTIHYAYDTQQRINEEPLLRAPILIVLVAFGVLLVNNLALLFFVPPSYWWFIFSLLGIILGLGLAYVLLVFFDLRSAAILPYSQFGGLLLGLGAVIVVLQWLEGQAHELR